MIKFIISFIKKFQHLLTDPQSNAALLLVMGLMFLVIVLFISVTAYNLIISLKNYRRRRRNTVKAASALPEHSVDEYISIKQSRRLKLLIPLGIVVVIAMFVFTVFFAAVSNSNFCGRTCHSMNPDYQSWRRSSHAAVPCLACHRSSSIPGTITQVFFNSRSIYKEITGSYSLPINSQGGSAAKIANTVCLACHSPNNRHFNVRSGLNMTGSAHIKHLKAGVRCVNCHNRVAHSEAKKYAPIKGLKIKVKSAKSTKIPTNDRVAVRYPNYLHMKEGCWRCHKAGGIFADFQGKKHLGPYQAANGATAPTACSTCHNTDWDKKPKNHQVSDLGVKWSRGLIHGPKARQDFSSCQGCHDKNTWCSTQCHKGMTMPHIKNWQVAHRDRAKIDRKFCDFCHKVDDTLNFCGNRCHHDKFKKQFKLSKKVEWRIGKKQHGKVVKAIGVSECLRCHEQSSWCTTKCHGGITMPHPGNWKQVHFKGIPYKRSVYFKEYDIKGLVCNKCHNKDGKSKDFCFDCHHSGLRKLGVNFPSGSRGVLMVAAEQVLGTTYELDNAEACATCHVVEVFCAECHKVGAFDRDE